MSLDIRKFSWVLERYLSSTASVQNSFDKIEFLFCLFEFQIEFTYCYNLVVYLCYYGLEWKPGIWSIIKYCYILMLIPCVCSYKRSNCIISVFVLYLLETNYCSYLVRLNGSLKIKHDKEKLGTYYLHKLTNFTMCMAVVFRCGAFTVGLPLILCTNCFITDKVWNRKYHGNNNIDFHFYQRIVMYESFHQILNIII